MTFSAKVATVRGGKDTVGAKPSARHSLKELLMLKYIDKGDVGIISVASLTNGRIMLS